MTIPTDGRIDLDALAPCPFCGWKPDWHDDTTSLDIYCPNEDCGGARMLVDGGGDYRERAIAAWNRRVAIPSEQGEAVTWPFSDEMLRKEIHLAAGCQEHSARTDRVVELFKRLYTHPAPVAGVKVKALEWRELTSPREDGPAEPNGEWEALCVFGAYSIDFDTDDDVAKYPFCVWTPEDSLGHFASADDAKAAAQADYEQRILSAIDVAPAAEPVLPCDVKLPPATTIAKGCKLSTLHEALRVRGMHPPVSAAADRNPVLEEAAKIAETEPTLYFHDQQGRDSAAMRKAHGVAIAAAIRSLKETP